MWVGGVADSQTRSKPLKTPPNFPENRGGFFLAASLRLMFINHEVIRAVAEWLNVSMLFKGCLLVLRGFLLLGRTSSILLGEDQTHSISWGPQTSSVYYIVESAYGSCGWVRQQTDDTVVAELFTLLDRSTLGGG